MRLRFSVAAALIFCAALTPVGGQQAPAPGAAPQAAPRPRSPEIHPDRTVTFRLLAPNATDVILNGDWDNRQKSKADEGRRRHLVDDRRSTRAAVVGLLVLVDGVKVLDPGTPKRSVTACVTTTS